MIRADQAEDRLRQLTEEAVHSATHQSYLEVVEKSLSQFLPADDVAWNDVDLAMGHVHVERSEGADPAFGEAILAVAADHAMIRSYRPAGATCEPRRMSDLLPQNAFKGTATYNELFRPLGLEYQLTIFTSRVRAQHGHCWVLNRSGTDFSDLEVQIATHLQGLLSLLENAYLVSPSSAQESCTDPEALDLVDRLTSREVEVLQLVARGYTAHKVGTILTVSPTTVRKHLENAYRKLGCSDRLVAVDVLRQAGLLRPRPPI